MNRPGPQVGQIVRFDYLWCDEAETGRDHGAKDRPCAVVVARRSDRDDREIVLLAPITHAPPASGVEAIALPADTGRTTGLDDDRSWLIVSEVNLVDWSDAGFVPIKHDRWLYGHLPRSIAKRAVAAVHAKLSAGRMRMTKR